MQTLLRRRDELQALLAGFDVAAEPLKGSGRSPAGRRRLRDIRQGEARAIEALDRLEWIIADTAAENFEELALKVRFYAELGCNGEAPGTWRASFTVQEHLLRTILADLKRLRKNRHTTA